MVTRPAQVGDQYFRPALAELTRTPELSGVVLILLGCGVGDQVIELSVEGEILQPMVLAVGDQKHGLIGSPRIAEIAVRALRLIGRVPFAGEGAEVIALHVVVVNVAQAVAIGHIEIAVRGECGERRLIGIGNRDSTAFPRPDFASFGKSSEKTTSPLRSVLISLCIPVVAR